MSGSAAYRASDWASGTMFVMGNASGARDVSAALDEVERQLGAMPNSDLLGQEDLEWSIGTVFVNARVRSTDPLVVELEASQGVLRRSAEKRIVRVNPN